MGLPVASLVFLSSLLFTPSLAQNGTIPQPQSEVIRNATQFAFGSRNLTTITIEYAPASLFINGTQEYNVTFNPIRRTVSYFVSHGLAIIDGDVAFGTEAEILAARVPDGTQVPHKRYAADEPVSDIAQRALSFTRYDSRKWPGGEIQYYWESAETKTAREADWLRATKIWTDRLPFLKFVSKGISATTTLNGPVVLKRPKPDEDQNVSWSPVGRATSADGNAIVLGDIGSSIGVYVHEIGHTLGLMHEQLRPDRDSYITVDCSRVCGQYVYKPPPHETEVDHCIDAKCAPGPGGCSGYGCQFVQISPTDTTWDWSGPYDVLSIMQYGSLLFARPETGWAPVLQARDPRIPLRRGNGVVPSLTDLQRICAIYWEDCRGICGDGILSLNNGEECDDSNNDDNDGCSSSCKVTALCGNGILEPGEQCDDGNLVNGDGCNSNCKREYCGDGIVQPNLGEECDGGPGGSPTCTSSCKKPCLQTCDPDPRFNHCDITTSCIEVVGGSPASAGKHYCACAHGFRATDPGNAGVQMRLPWAGQEGRVFVTPGTQCNVLCDQWTLGRDGCKEVQQRDMCY